jgi:fused signal recognition particle receptor
MEPLIVVLVVATLLAAVLIGFLGTRGKERPPTGGMVEDDVARRAPDIDAEDPLLPEAPPKPRAPAEPEAAAEEEPPPPFRPEPEPEPEPEPLSPAERFRRRLGRARSSLGSAVAAVFGRGLGDDTWDDLEEALIAADVGVEAATEIVEALRQRVTDDGVRTGDEALALLKALLRDELAGADRSLRRRADGTSVWLVTGVNGTGKTTSIGKVAARHTRDGETVVLAAADTFRAAAAEQLELWGQRSGARVIRQAQGADPAAVAFDGWQAARAANAQLLIVDTAGRLQNKTQLMAELSKVKRVLERDAGPCDEVLLVLDATTGQNGLSQARAFMEAVNISGVVLTKLDSTARGGIVIAIQRELGIPVKLVGLGEDIDDLADFDPDLFVEALFAEVEQEIELADPTEAAG